MQIAAAVPSMTSCWQCMGSVTLLTGAIYCLAQIDWLVPKGTLWHLHEPALQIPEPQGLQLKERNGAGCNVSTLWVRRARTCGDKMIQSGYTCGPRYDSTHTYLPDAQEVLDPHNRNCDAELVYAVQYEFLQRRHNGFHPTVNASFFTGPAAFGKAMKNGILVQFDMLTNPYGPYTGHIPILRSPVGSSKWSKLVKWNNQTCGHRHMDCFFDINKPIYGASIVRNLLGEARRLFAMRNSMERTDQADWGLHILLMGALSQALYSPTPLIKAFYASRLLVFNHTQKMTRPGHSVSIHFRQGDSCGNRKLTKQDERLVWSSNVGKCWTWAVYMQLLQKMDDRYGVDTVYLSTDSTEVVTEIQKVRKFNWVMVSGNRNEFRPGSTWIEYRNTKQCDTAMLSFTDMYHLSHGDVFIGNLASFYSALAIYAIVGRIGRLPPFVSVQGATLCPACEDHRLNQTARWCMMNDQGHCPLGKEECKPGSYRRPFKGCMR